MRIAVLALALAASPSIAAENLISNGDFSNGLAGWSSHGWDVYDAFGTGNVAVGLNIFSPGIELKQQVNVDPGERYIASYQLGGGASYNPTTIDVSVGDSGKSYLLNSGSTLGQRFLDFTATGPNATISFSNNCFGCNAVYLDNVAITKFSSLTAADIVSGAVQIKPDGPAIRAFFIPNYGLSISDAATALGFQNFNWQQTVTQIDGPNIVRDQAGNYIQTPFLDPIAGGYYGQRPNLSFPYYYNNSNTSPFASDNLVNHISPDGHDLAFGDQPANPCYGPAWELHKDICGNAMTNGFEYFTTTLVGVRGENLAPIPLFQFKWKSNFSHLSGGVVFADPDQEPRDGTGGVTLLSQELLVGVPEPSIWALLLGGFGLVGFAARRRSTKLSYA